MLLDLARDCGTILKCEWWSGYIVKSWPYGPYLWDKKISTNLIKCDGFIVDLEPNQINPSFYCDSIYFASKSIDTTDWLGNHLCVYVYVCSVFTIAQWLPKCYRERENQKKCVHVGESKRDSSHSKENLHVPLLHWSVKSGKEWKEYIKMYIQYLNW